MLEIVRIYRWDKLENIVVIPSYQTDRPGKYDRFRLATAMPGGIGWEYIVQ